MSYHSSRIIDNIVDNDEEGDYAEEISEQGADVVEMVIELDSHNSVTIEIHPHDDPTTLAKKFCYQYNIDPKIITSFARNIKNIQASSFQQQEDYSSLIVNQGKENSSTYSNTAARPTDTGLNRSKATYKKHNTFNNDETVTDDRSVSWSQANASRTSVFDRLYQDSKTKMSKRALSKSKVTESKKVLNDSLYHNTSTDSSAQIRIYEKNCKLQQQAAKRSQMMKERIQEMEVESCPMKPKINPLSRLIAEKLREVSHDNLSKSREKNLVKTIEYIREKEAKQLKQCTFHPKILKKSRRQAINSDRYLLLHEDHTIRELKSQTTKAAQLKKMFERSNTPKINEVSRRLVSGRSFAHRMEQYKSTASKNKQKILREVSSECRHRPSTGKQPENRNKGTMSVGEYLYAKSKQKAAPARSSSKKVAVNHRSEIIYEEIKRHAFRYIFTLMDNDQDGYISSLKINILGLETEVLHLLAPLLCEMEDLQIELDEQEFVDSLERLFNTYNVHQKNLVLNVYKNPRRKDFQSEQPSFHPSLNEKSVQMAREIREPGISLYELGREKSMEKQSRLSELRALRAMMDYEECTFHPNLFHHHH